MKLALCAAAAITLVAACQRQAPATGAAPVTTAETPCWWTVYRTDLPLGAVAVRLADAFSNLGLTDAKLVQHGDTAWANAGPTRIAARFGGTFSARAVAFQRGDSTLYRYFVTAEPPPGGWRKGYDSVTVTGAHISVIPASSALAACAAISSHAQTGGKAPKAPNGEERVAIWSSRPSASPGATPAGVRIDTIAILLRAIEPAKADSLVLDRTPCFGVCPPYRLRIARSGEVAFQSRAGRDTTHSLTSIPADDARRLFERADLLRFDALPDTIARSTAYCHDEPTDYPTAITTIFVGLKSKHVVDYEGCDWAPVGLRVLEAMVDSVAGTRRFLAPRVAR